MYNNVSGTILYSFLELGEDYYELTKPLYDFPSEITAQDSPYKICQCCINIENDKRLEDNEIFYIFLEEIADLDERIIVDPTPGYVVITDDDRKYRNY